MLPLTRAIFICLASQAISISVFERLGKQSEERWNLQRTKRQAALSTNNRDVLFVLDGTVGSANFAKLVRMTKSLVNSFCGNIGVGKDQTRVGVVTFDSSAQQAIDFNDYFSKATLISRVERLRPSRRPGKACIANALEYAADVSFVPSRGARVGISKTEGMVILLTQGCDNCNANDLKRVSSVLTQKGIILFAFHVAGNDQCVKNMALLSDGSTCSQLFWSTTWSAFDIASKRIASIPCMDLWLIGPPCSASYNVSKSGPWTEWGQCSVSCGGGVQTRSKSSCSSSGTCSSDEETQKCNTQACPQTRDVLFLLDETVGHQNFSRFLSFTDGLAKKLCGNIAIAKDRTRVGAVMFGSNVKRIIDFDDTFSSYTFRSSILRFRPSFRPGKACIADALEYSLDNLFIKSRGARVGDSTTIGMIILLTQGCDGCNYKDLKRVSSLLQHHGITISVLHVSSDDSCRKNMTLLAEGSTCYQQSNATWSELQTMINTYRRPSCSYSWQFPRKCDSTYKARQVWPWTEWGRCSVSCGGGIQTRFKKSCTAIGICSSDKESRDCNSQTCPECRGEWTAWFDRDDPSGNGDYEDLASHRNERKLDVCISPSLVDGRVVRIHTNWYHTGNILTMAPTSGLTCVNSKQKNGLRCKDYEVRFCCPKIENRKEVQFVGQTFLRTVLSISGGSSAGSSRRSDGESSETESNCKRRSYSDSSNNLRMIGKDCKSGRRKRQALPAGPVVRRRDVLFLIDESGSVGSVNFQIFKRLAQAFVNSFCGDIAIAESMTRVGVLSFDRTQHVHLNFNEAFDKSSVLNKIADISYDSITAGSTCLIPSLRFTRESMFTPARGARIAQPGTEQVLILFSDGCANCEPSNERPALLKAMGESFSQQGVSIITYLVGKHSSSCIEQMGNLIDGAHCYQEFLIDDWDQVNFQIDGIEEAECSNSWKLTPAC